MNLFVAPELELGFDLEGLTLGVGVSFGFVPIAGSESHLGDVFVDAPCDPMLPRDAACAPAESFLAREIVNGGFVFVAPTARLGYRF